MLRKLLTLLAICAGLTAVAEPARAAVTVFESVQVVQLTRSSCTARAASLAQPGVFLTQRVQDKGKICPKPTVVVVVPTVMLQADRARE